MSDFYTNDEVANEIRSENEAEEMKKIQPKSISRFEVNAAKYIWQIGVIVLDLATAYYIWQTTLLFYGILWALIGSGGLLWSERQRERIGNNETQERIGNWGVTVSAVIVLLMALAMGAVYLTNSTAAQWIMVTVEVTTVLLFSYHLVQAYRYHLWDDEYREQNADAIAEARNISSIRQIHRAARRVESMKRRTSYRSDYQRKHGPAFDEAYNVIRHDSAQKQGKQEKQQGSGKQFQPAYNAETKQEQIKENGGHTVNPQTGEGRK